MTRVLVPGAGPASRRPATAAERAEDARLALSRRVGNQALQRMLSARRRQLMRNPVQDAPKVAKVLLGKDDLRSVAEALELLRVAERIPFYKPVVALALSGNVLNPEGLKIAVSELYAKARDVKDPTGPLGMAHEILYALELSKTTKVQLGGWKPDHLQKGMKDLSGKIDDLPAYLSKIAEVEVPLGVGWGGDTVAWGTDGKKLSVRTIQHKVLTSDKDESFGRELVNAAQQLAGERQEHALPGSTRVASLVITNSAHPAQNLSASELESKIVKELGQGFGVQALNQFVDKVEVTTETMFFEFDVKGPVVKLVKQEKSGLVAALKENAPKPSKEKATPQVSGGSTLAIEEQKKYEAAVGERTRWVKSQPDPGKLLIDAAVSAVTSKKTAKDKRDAWKEEVAKLAEQDKDAAGLLELLLFVRCGWVQYGDDEAKARKEPDYQTKMKESSAKLKDRTENVTSKRKEELESQWALTDPTSARVIAAGDELEDARERLDDRRKLPEHKTDWDKLEELRDKRLTEVAVELGLTDKQDVGTAKVLELEWSRKNPEDAASIGRLEDKLSPKYWCLESDSQPIRDAIDRIVRVENAPDYVGEVAGARAKLEKRARREARTELAAQEKKRFPRLEAVLTTQAKLNDRMVREIFATIGEVKESEGNAREVARVVEELTPALEAAWKAPEGAIDRDKLLETTEGLARVGAGITYIGLAAELRDAARLSAEPDRKGIMIGQWYALEKTDEPDWKAADVVVREQIKKAKEPPPKETKEKPKEKPKDYKKQEVDVSFYEGETLHIREVAANVEVLRAKLLDDTKKTQRESYLQIQKDRKANLTYVLDSDRDWRKIYEFGAGRGKKRLPPREAPMIKFLIDNNVTLVINGSPYDKQRLEEQAKTVPYGGASKDEKTD